MFVYLREMAKDLGERLGWMVFHGHMVPEEKAKAYKEIYKYGECYDGCDVGVQPWRGC